MSDRPKNRIREAIVIGAAVSAAALGVGVAVAATSPSLVPTPQTDEATVASGEFTPPPPRVKGYTILRSSSLVMDTPSGLRIVFGTGMAVTGVPDLDALVERVKANNPAAKAAPRHGATAPTAPTAGTTEPVVAEPDFPGLGEEHRSDRADPKRSERAIEQAERSPSKSNEVTADAGDGRGRNK